MALLAACSAPRPEAPPATAVRNPQVAEAAAPRSTAERSPRVVEGSPRGNAPQSLDALLPDDVPTPRIDTGDEVTTAWLQPFLDGLDEAIRIARTDLANLDTVGYRAARPEFQLLPKEGRTELVVRARREWRQGAVQPSDDPLHCAIEGEGFFCFADADGELKFTRDGRFRVSDRRYLCHQAGGELFPLLEVPPGHSLVSIAANGDVLARAGATDEQTRVLGRLQLSRFVAGDTLGGDGVRFTAREGHPMTGDPSVRDLGCLVPQSVERSNVDHTAATAHLLHHLARKQIAVLVLDRLFPALGPAASTRREPDSSPPAWTSAEREALRNAARDLVHGAVFGVRNGPHLRTGRAFDLAIDGENWLAIQLVTGELAYLPSACAEVNPDGRLVYPGSLALQPEITLPGDWLNFRVAADGKVFVSCAGNPGARTYIGTFAVHLGSEESIPQNDNGSLPNLGTRHETMLPGENGAGAIRGGEVEVGDAGDEGLLRLAITVTQLRRARAQRSGTPADRLPFALDAASAKALLEEAAADAAIWVEAWSYALCGEPEAASADGPQDPPAHERPAKSLMGWRDASTIERPKLAHHVAAMKFVLARRLQRLAIALPKPQ